MAVFQHFFDFFIYLFFDRNNIYIIFFSPKFGFMLDITMFTVSLATPNTLKSEEIGLSRENPVSCYHMLCVI